MAFPDASERILQILNNNSPSQNAETRALQDHLYTFMTSAPFDQEAFKPLLEVIPQARAGLADHRKWLQKALDALNAHQHVLPLEIAARARVLKWTLEAQHLTYPSATVALRKYIELSQARAESTATEIQRMLPHLSAEMQVYAQELRDGTSELDELAEFPQDPDPATRALAALQQLTVFEKWTYLLDHSVRGTSLLERIHQQPVEFRRMVLMTAFTHPAAPAVHTYTLDRLLQQEQPLDPELIQVIFEWAGKWHSMWFHDPLFKSISLLAKSALEAGTLPETTAAMLRRTAAVYAASKEAQQALNWLPTSHPNAGEHWADQVLSDLKNMPAPKPWLDFFKHSIGFTGSKPNARLLRTFQKQLEALPTPEEQVLSWLKKVCSGRSLPLRTIPNQSHNQSEDGFNTLLLRGLIWLCAFLPYTPELPRTLAQIAEYSLKKVPGVGPRSPRIAHACIYVLGQMEHEGALVQLARLKSRTLLKPTLKEIEKALAAKASKLGISTEDLEELGMPTFGLDETGCHTEQWGDITARLDVSGQEVELSFWNAAGTEIRSLPARLKHEHAEELRELRASSKDIRQMLTTVAGRLDGLYLQQKSWPVQTWQERYLHHPLVGTVVRRLIWNFNDGDQKTSLIWNKGKFVNAHGQVQDLPAHSTVTLWHPLDTSSEEVLRWRDFILQQEVTQPFKQAFREVYLLTAAEEHTRVYSNRFASHILKQHPFHALCAVRGWTDSLRMMVDAYFPPPTKILNAWNLRAEFWVEGAGDEHGVDTNESGTYLYLATDQVRFYALNASENLLNAPGSGETSGFFREPLNADPLPLQDIPALVFSEVMRDVDLFVGVCSVGNDPNWMDSGLHQHHDRYWQDYSFGELGATAVTRKELLSRILPRLSIREQVFIEGRFLKVKGKIRTYKIHLGSGNILMEPNDEYLCIVPARGVGQNAVVLPFDGDHTLSIILSKAFLLAEDQKIIDPTIVRQIR
ncbi:DUF4132 domain-containing protein [Deinococcus cellulosilyticus]|uniref:Uncharacterized protein n=1 Tax=Deinococcus cellulosilyticus (strain DSM 18568 / NBRC 106333 / KACC 11606 / 5516J-15) TaxID=1223518 RepID=A0A511N1H2_DEIC1|nr:DUF4132 domain-containing protein [Deinococcus cellulosilyticus]GEM46740.1 hypothetical protein DC3_23750 [Deinococcus cellulosilyticus NBRC 106333 = KACC 11606]